jgi:hypothetical protein
MSKQRATFGKLQRERDKQAKAAAKRDRRANRIEEQTGEDGGIEPAADQGAVLAALATLHEVYEDGKMSTEDFEAQRDELRSRLVVD